MASPRQNHCQKRFPERAAPTTFAAGAEGSPTTVGAGAAGSTAGSAPVCPMSSVATGPNEAEERPPVKLVKPAQDVSVAGFVVMALREHVRTRLRHHAEVTLERGACEAPLVVAGGELE